MGLTPPSANQIYCFRLASWLFASNLICVKYSRLHLLSYACSCTVGIMFFLFDSCDNPSFNVGSLPWHTRCFPSDPRNDAKESAESSYDQFF